jgi:hypothetical protein
MRRFMVVAVALASGLLVARARGDDAATTGKAAEAAAVASFNASVERLKKQIHVEVTAAPANKTVAIGYHLREDPQKLDWEDFAGQIENVFGRGHGWGGTFAEVAAENGSALLLHKTPMKGDFSFEADFYLRCLDKDQASFAFVLGYDPKTHAGIAAPWGESLVLSNGHSKATSEETADMDPYKYLHRAVVRIVRKAGCVTLYLNGTRRAAVTSMLDGQWGVLVRNMRVGVIRLAMTGTPVVPEDEKPAEKDAKAVKKN